MARPREFDANDALERAMDVFWTRGYAATSLVDLTDAMGISKSSLYETFGNKRDLFLAALDHYAQSRVGQMVAVLEGDRPGREAIAAVLATLVERALAGRTRSGCFLANCASEVAPHDPDTRRLVAAALGRMERAFHSAVARAQAEGAIAPGRNARALARFLVAVANGLQVLGKAGFGRETLENVVGVALAALDRDDRA